MILHPHRPRPCLGSSTAHSCQNCRCVDKATHISGLVHTGAHVTLDPALYAQQKEACSPMPRVSNPRKLRTPHLRLRWPKRIHPSHFPPARNPILWIKCPVTKTSDPNSSESVVSPGTERSSIQMGGRQAGVGFPGVTVVPCSRSRGCSSRLSSKIRCTTSLGYRPSSGASSREPPTKKERFTIKQHRQVYRTQHSGIRGSDGGNIEARESTHGTNPAYPKPRPFVKPTAQDKIPPVAMLGPAAPGYAGREEVGPPVQDHPLWLDI